MARNINIDTHQEMWYDVETKLNSFLFWAKQIMHGKLSFETDWDFSILYKGEIYSDYDFDIYINSAQDFDSIVFLGPWGSGPASGKFSEVEEMLQKIRANPSEPKCFLGGNRGVEWTPYANESDDIIERAKKIAQELNMLPRETVLKMFGEILGVNDLT